MTIAKYKIGEGVLGNLGGVPPPAPALPEPTPTADLFPPSPIVVFIKLESKTGDTIKIVDFGRSDVDPTALVQYDGESYSPFHIGFPKIEKNLSGRLSSFSIPIIDPLYTFRNFVIANNNLDEAKLFINITEYRHKDDISKSRSFTFFVTGVTFSENPPTVGVELGNPPVLGIGSPSTRFNDILCPNPYHFRFRHGTNLNPCHYPSADFLSSSDKQFFAHSSLTAQTDTAKEHKDGWITEFRTRAEIWRTDPQLGGLELETKSGVFNYAQSNRDSCVMYKSIPAIDADGTFDVWTSFPAGRVLSGDLGVIAALVVLEFPSYAVEFDEANTLIFGVKWDTGSASGGLYREVLGDVPAAGVFTADSDYVVSSGYMKGDLRIERTDNETFKLYSYPRYLAADWWNTPWELLTTLTITTISPRVKIGFVIFNTGTSGKLKLTAERLTFFNGGLPACDFTLAGSNGCRVHKNERQRNAFRGLTSGRRGSI